MFFVPNRRSGLGPYASVTAPQPSFMQSTMDSLMDSYQSSMTPGIKVVDPDGEEWMEQNSIQHLQQGRPRVPSLITVTPDMGEDEPVKLEEGETLILSDGKVLPQIPSRLKSQVLPDEESNESVESVPKKVKFKNQQLSKVKLDPYQWHEILEHHPLATGDPSLQRLYQILRNDKVEQWKPFVYQPYLTYDDTGLDLIGSKLEGHIRHHLNVPLLRLYPFGMSKSNYELTGEIEIPEIEFQKSVNIGKDKFGQYIELPELKFGKYKIKINLINIQS